MFASVEILCVSFIVALLSSFVKFVLTKYGVSKNIAEWYDMNKQPWMPDRCEYCFNVELCIIVAVLLSFCIHSGHYIIIPFVAAPIQQFIEK